MYANMPIKIKFVKKLRNSDKNACLTCIIPYTSKQYKVL